MIGIAEIVDRVILHAQTMLDDGAYDWPTSRSAVGRILADLETRSEDDQIRAHRRRAVDELEFDGHLRSPPPRRLEPPR